MSTTTRTTSGASSTRGPSNGHFLTRIVVGFALVAILASLVGVVLSGASYEPAPGGLPDAGLLVSWLLPASGALVFAAAMATIGWLLLAGFLDPDMGKKTVSMRGRKALLRAGIAAAVWCVAAVLSALLTLASVLGVPLSEAASPSIFTTYAWDVEDVRALLIAAVIAAVVSVGAILTVELTKVTIWLALALVAVAAPATAGHAAGLGDHSMALTNSVVHAVTASVWVGGLIALGAVVWPKAGDVSVAAQRFGYLAIASVILLTVSGLGNAYVRLGAPSDLFTSGYGRLVLIKAALLIVLVATASWIRRRLLPNLNGDRARQTFAKVAVLELALMAIASGLGVALSMTVPTREEIQFQTQAESLLGFEFPASPTASSVLLGWDFDLLFFTLSVAACVFYVMGVRRLKARGDSWPILQTVSWFVGWGIFIWTTNAGISTYSQVSVGLHMIQHMTIVMMAPIFLVLAAPVTLALRAIKPSPTGGPRSARNDYVRAALEDRDLLHQPASHPGDLRLGALRALPDRPIRHSDEQPRRAYLHDRALPGIRAAVVLRRHRHGPQTQAAAILGADAARVDSDCAARILCCCAHVDSDRRRRKLVLTRSAGMAGGPRSRLRHRRADRLGGR